MAGKERMIRPATPIRVLILSMDAHLLGPARNAEHALRQSLPGLTVELFSAADWEEEGPGREQVLDSIARADIIATGMIFLESQAKPILSALEARAPHCDAFAGCLATPEIVRLTRLGKFRMDKPASGPMALLKKLRGKGGTKQGQSDLKMLSRLPKILKFIPGTAQDVRVYFLALQYWLGGSDENIKNLIAVLINKYAAGSREPLRDLVTVGEPVVYPETGLYHPRMTPRIGDELSRLPQTRRGAPRVGVLIMRSYALSADTEHYDGVIAALEAKGLNVVPAFASGLDARPVINQYFMKDGRATIDGLVSLTGFSLVGGPAYNDASAAAEVLGTLDVPYISAHALEFQSLPDWGASAQGLSPVEATMMVAMPELDGATSPTLFGGRTAGQSAECEGCSKHCTFEDARGEKKMRSCPDGAAAIAGRMAKMIHLRRVKKAEQKTAIVLFNFPPNAGAVGAAAQLSVYESLFNLLAAMKAGGHHVDVPSSVDALRHALIEGNAARYGTNANVHHEMPVDRHVREERRLAAIEDQWGPAPGREQTDGKSLFILGAEFGNVFVGIQPAFGYEGDPMRLLFEADFAPTHAFCAFYRYLREEYAADAVIHFGTHGALEFLPGKQTGLSGECWPNYLIGELPNYYFYAANNPSEAAIAKRRSAATTISYLTSSITKAGLYRSLADLKQTIDRWRSTDPTDKTQLQSLALLAQAQAASLEMAAAEPPWDGDSTKAMAELYSELIEYEEALIPDGLHVAGKPPTEQERIDTLRGMAGEGSNDPLPDDVIVGIASGEDPNTFLDRFQDDAETERIGELIRVNRELQTEHELTSLLSALDGRFIQPTAGGDLVSNSKIIPTGRNIHGFDPFRMPSAFAVRDGRAQAQKLIDRHLADNGSYPETVAFVLWGTDNLKTEGAQVAQALSLMGAEPRFDHYGRLAGAQLLPLETLDHPRIDVMSTLSGIFRDLLPMQTRLLAEAALLAAEAKEPLDKNYVRKHALAYQAEHGVDLETAALRVFSNGDGAYGANVNRLIDDGCWENDDDLANAYTNRKSFAYGVNGQAKKSEALLDSILANVDLAYQNLESIELGVTTIDHYFDTLGGIGKAVRRARGEDPPIYIGDQTRGNGTVRTLNEQVNLESRTRTLNPKWYEGMLKHGYEGVRQIEAQVTHTLGWSATTGKVAPWVYQEIANTFMLDENLRDRLASLNPRSAARVANRLLEASDRNFWAPDAATLDALQAIGDELDDRVEGILPAEGATA